MINSYEKYIKNKNRKQSYDFSNLVSEIITCNAKLCYPKANMTGCLFILVCLLHGHSYQQKQVKIYTVINYKMTITCNYMLNSIKKVNIKGSCGILW